MKIKVIFYSLLCLLVLACSKDDDDDNRDTEKPTIDMTAGNSFPQNCVILHRGESFKFRALFSDDQELGSYNIEIHNNFDHHSHSTDDVECDLEPKKTPVKPFVYNQDFFIPAGKNSFEASNEISIPLDIDTGDYHFMIRLTDKAGWQQLKAVSLKIKDQS